MRKGSLLNKWFWENWTATCKSMNPDYYLIPYTEIIPKWIKDIGDKFLDIGFGDDFFFFDLSPKAKITKAKINK